MAVRRAVTSEGIDDRQKERLEHRHDRLAGAVRYIDTGAAAERLQLRRAARIVPESSRQRDWIFGRDKGGSPIERAPDRVGQAKPVEGELVREILNVEEVLEP